MSSHRDWATLEALKNSPKGRLQYNREWSLEEDIMESSCMLSPYAAWVVDKILPNKNLNNSFECDGLSSDSNSLSCHPESPVSLSDAATDVPGPKAEKEEELDVAPPTISKSFKMIAVEGTIRLYEDERKTIVKKELQARLDNFDQFSKSLAEKSAEQFKRFEEMLELKQRQEKHQLQELLEKSSKEALGQQEKLKEEHRYRAKLLTLKLREAEQQRQQELERARQEDGREKMRRLCALQQEALQLIQKIEVDQRLQETLHIDLSWFSQRGNQICGNLSNVVRSSSEGRFPSQDDVSFGERSVQEMRTLVSNMEKIVAETQERLKAEEQAAQQKQRAAEQLQQQQEQARASAPTQENKTQAKKKGFQRTAEKSLIEQYMELLTNCEKCRESFNNLNSCTDAKTKKTKADLQKAVTTPVSQISRKSGRDVEVVFKKLNTLLKGEQLNLRFCTVTLSQHPEALDFVSYKLAERFVKQAEEEVASHHDAAYPLAAVVSAVWEWHPRVGDLFLAHLYKKCPYAVPYYPIHDKGTSLNDYQRILGYQVQDSVVEQQDNFLKRMSGMIRLYAALIQTRWPYETKLQHHPHGLNYGWRWLAQVLNMEPIGDTTATLLYDFLEVCGNALMKQYQGQFWKLILLIREDLLPRLHKVAEPGQMGSLARLQNFIEKAVQQKHIPLPNGYLPSSFWNS
ncbi:mRNA export factor GLE1 [Hyperolius riggenbachi]|uniref:mRNA export factor GLE1 n=1 Tax=Hyperolius riggenbachi TaxID=752182 RepID=UPI0035A37467